MTDLFDILGRAMASAEVTKVLARYPALKAELDETPGEAPEPVRYLRSERDGLLIKLSADGDVLAIFLMSEGKEGFSQFAGPMPGNLSFESRPADALKTFGAPAYSRPAGKVGSYEHGELLRFDYPHHSVHFQYRKGGGIDLVTAATAETVPGRSVAR